MRTTKQVSDQMNISSKRVIGAIAGAALVGMSVLAAAPAGATSSAGSATFPNGVASTANAWIQSMTWTGCGDFQTSAMMTAAPNYISNSTAFYEIGVSSIQLKALNITDSEVSPTALLWTNTNGAKGSYLSGSVCGGWTTVYLGMNVTAKAFYDGNLRTAAAHI